MDHPVSDRSPVPRTIVRRIQEMIAAGELRPGQKLPSQRELSSRFSISRASLREGLSVLETLGIIRTEHGKAAVICSERPTRTGRWRYAEQFAAAEVFQFRMLIESYAARLMAASADSVQIAHLLDLQELMRRALVEEDFEAAANADAQFHRAIVQASGNKGLVAAYSGLSGVLKESHLPPLAAQDRLNEPIQEHAAIIHAVRDGDCEGALFFAKRHVLLTAGRSGIPKAVSGTW